ncbi:hypothetical protein Aab01nite_31510 [Paractinoplanes abujensis]|uniref:Uncharacterized protein n=1 Tax=Paractinoplanes abujensis TaxID=882441 RepID=A0A7W7D360_9ACTN|nr:hypothetical protein [Actinoplanes abujensis]MBB4697956.1 hypothetical protein [Actinoplanes abujensis]GID19561.1 hypothetical protein Aab01nite_31510 [Actinoplanes abujensis]
MSDDQRGLRGLRAGHWLLIGLVVALVAAGITVVVTRGGGDPTVAEPTSSPSASVSVPPRPDCAPDITGTYADASRARFGFVYRSRCDQVVRELRFRVTVRDASGNEAATVEQTASGGVLFPGAELATAGELRADTNMKIGSVTVAVVNYSVFPPEDFSAWARTEVTGLTRGKPDSYGQFDVTGEVEARPPSAPVCVAEFVLIMRDRNDKIVFAAADPVLGGGVLRPEFPVSKVPALDFARTKIYAPQTPRTEQPPRAGMACNGS